MKQSLTAINNLKAYELRIGNIVVCIDEKRADAVVALEPGCIHLSRKAQQDDERNIFGAFITTEALQLFGFKKISQCWIHAKAGIALLQITNQENKLTLRLLPTSAGRCNYRYIHELQNGLFVLYGLELHTKDFLSSL